ncbi:hypothetical protein MMG00_12745 [Ignatzschineria rhizosphaerae]|uniref:Uncharacterized protein n=1 Tax=Ignatzschineria rhizosphaerae TaxID=2923279 RepID=A0ABY3X2W6_9GAMM|nr:hypothetical protein [Ignatzschineria rhizosphaerae]UNM96049.1 hypothetical protein MMG00_12745 [Ignatzschineria rhizosphaerae]
MSNQEKPLKKMIIDALQRGDLDIKDMPMHELEWLKRRVSEEIDQQRGSEKVLLIGVGGTHLFDKHFLEKDEKLAREYALKRAKEQFAEGRQIEVVMSYHKVWKSELKEYLSMRGQYE